MMAFLEFTFRDGWHFVGVCVLIYLAGVMATAVAAAIRGPKP